MIVSYYEASLAVHGISFSSDASRSNGIISMLHYKLISLVNSETGQYEQMTDILWDEIEEKTEEMVRSGHLISYPIQMPNIKTRSGAREIIIVANIIHYPPSACGGTNRRRDIPECRGCGIETKGFDQTLCPSCESINSLTRPVVIAIEKRTLAEIVEGTITVVAWKKLKYMLQLVDYRFSNKKEEQGAMLNYVDTLIGGDVVMEDGEKGKGDAEDRFGHE